jgi:hypothetical protein
MLRRKLPVRLVLGVASNPAVVLAVRPGREIRQAIVVDRAVGKSYLVRVVMDVSREADVIVTAYKTSRIARYRGES